jgi:hypothetical protein
MNQHHHFENAQKVSYLVQKALEFINHKTDVYLQSDPKREQTRAEPVFLKDMRTVTMGLGRAAGIMLYISTMVEKEGLVVVGGLDIHNDDLAHTLTVLSEGRQRLVDKLALKHTHFSSKITRVIVLHEQHGLSLREFFSWVAEQPHDETLEIIIFSM